MQYLLRFAFCLVLLFSAAGINVYGAVHLTGDGGIGFDGTGWMLVQQFPELVFERFESNCTPSSVPGVIFLCRQPLDMSLLGNDIVRAEHVRIRVSLHDLRIGVFLRFGCPACGTSVVVDEQEDLVLAAGGWRLSDEAIQALQGLIDQHGASSIYMSIGLNGGSVEVLSSVQAVTMDIKPGDVPNTVNVRSRGVIPVAILTTDEFDATSIDVSSLRFGATGEEAAAVHAVFADVDDDGDTDLLAFFRQPDTGIECEAQFVYLSAATLMGTNVAATDPVSLVSCRF